MASIESIFAAILVLPLFIISGLQYGYSSIANHHRLLTLLIMITAIEVWAFFELVRRACAVYVSFATFILA